MATTIQISKDLKKELEKNKVYDRETYEEVIWNLMEDRKELSEQAKRDILEARREIEQGRTHTLKDVKKELGLDV